MRRLLCRLATPGWEQQNNVRPQVRLCRHKGPTSSQRPGKNMPSSIGETMVPGGTVLAAAWSELELWGLLLYVLCLGSSLPSGGLTSHLHGWPNPRQRYNPRNGGLWETPERPQRNSPKGS